jgi:hypothetical protein
LRVGFFDTQGTRCSPPPRMPEGGAWKPVIMCPRTGKEITLDNVRTINVEHWPIRHLHGGPVDADNAIISLAEGHAEQTKREQKADAKERRLVIARKAKGEVEVKLTKPKWRLKKKLSGEVVKVRTR